MNANLLPEPLLEPPIAPGQPSAPNTIPRLPGRGRRCARILPEPLPDDYLESILQLAAQAPCGSHRPPWRFIVVREAAGRASLLPRPAPDEGGLGAAPVVVIAFQLRTSRGSDPEADRRHEPRSALGRPEALPRPAEPPDRFSEPSPSGPWLDRDTLMAVTTMMLVAEAFGIVAAPMEGFDPEGVKVRFGLPSQADVVALLALGFTEESSSLPHPAAPALQEIVHVEQYGRPWPGSAD